MDERRFHTALFRPGTIIDVGAHDGLLTLPLAALPGAHVLAFEPLPPAFARLQARVAGLANITLRPEALSNRAGRIVLEVPYVRGVAQEQWASMVKDYAGIAASDPLLDRVECHDVVTMPLDDLALTDVTAIKLDVEGAEEEVLRGAGATLARCQPILSVEIEERHRAGSTRDVPGLLASFGYAGFFALAGRWHPMQDFDAVSMQWALPSPSSFAASDPYVFTFYFVPDGRAPELLALPVQEISS